MLRTVALWVVYLDCFLIAASRSSNATVFLPAAGFTSMAPVAGALVVHVTVSPVSVILEVCTLAGFAEPDAVVGFRNNRSETKTTLPIMPTTRSSPRMVGILVGNFMLVCAARRKCIEYISVYFRTKGSNNLLDIGCDRGRFGGFDQFKENP